MSNSVKCILACLLFSITTACSDQSEITPEDLAGTYWELTNMPGDLPDGVEINLQFEENRIAGKGVCNRYFSEYTLENNQISFRAIAATEMMCMEHSDVEVKYFQTLETAKSLKMTGEQLTITTTEGNLIFTAAAAPAES